MANALKGADVEASAKLDFSHADAADNKVLNAILWRDRKGSLPMPVRHKSKIQRVKAGVDIEDK